MDPNKKIEEFDKLVFTKFNIYNSLFLNLPYSKDSNIGLLIPLMYKYCKEGLEAGQNPLEILDPFFEEMVKTKSEKDKIDFMFKLIQYVERQVVLFDSVEDAAFHNIQKYNNELDIKHFLHSHADSETHQKIFDKLSDFSARIVFTAHPTQFYTPSVLEIITSLRKLIAGNNINEINQKLHQLGLSSLINPEKPTPYDEAKNIIFFLRNVYYDAVGALYQTIKRNFSNLQFKNPDIIKLGFWPGGDRDGNPYVTAETTKNVADELRINLLECYYKDLCSLQSKLTFRGVDNIIHKLSSQVHKSILNSDEIIKFEDILESLNEARELLINNYHALYLDDLDELIDKVNIFKIHFACLDIRQDHSVHKNVIETILKKEKLINDSIVELNKAELTQILLHNDINAHRYEYSDELINDTIKNISQLHDIQARNGEEGCSRYIISNSEDIFSVLFVYALFKWCGWNTEELTFDIIPLFETMEGMKASETVMEELFLLEEYRKHVSARENKQTIMLGFSDGTKDGGYLKANWSIFNVKETLSAVCDKFGIKAVFFDGRGGPPARGGGKTHSFYAAQSSKTSNHEIQLTIQGQTITSKYATQEQFIDNCESLLTAALIMELSDKNNDISVKHRDIFDELAELSYKKFEQLKQHEMFIPYLEEKSTLKYYAKAKIGSRPGKRGNNKKLQLSDLRAISFVGAWSQMKQNVPGYYGIGTAIKNLIEQNKLEELKGLYREVPIFKALVQNSMMSLSKSNFKLTSYMQNDEKFGEFWNILYTEYKLSKKMLLLVSGSETLMQDEALTGKSIEIREKIVLPLLLSQQYALQKISENNQYIDLYEKIVVRSLYGNINASRNSV